MSSGEIRYSALSEVVRRKIVEIEAEVTEAAFDHLCINDQ
jgi:hypothetical protein